MSQVTSTVANRNFSKILSKARTGTETEITVRGEVVAKLVPVVKKDAATIAAERKEWEAFMERLRARPAMNLPKISRDELYD